MHRPIGARFPIFAGAIHRIDNPHPAFCQPLGIVLLLFGEQPILGALLAQGRHQEFIGGGIARLAQRLEAQQAAFPHGEQQLARHLGQMRGKLGVGQLAHIVGIQ